MLQTDVELFVDLYVTGVIVEAAFPFVSQHTFSHDWVVEFVVMGRDACVEQRGTLSAHEPGCHQWLNAFCMVDLGRFQ